MTAIFGIRGKHSYGFGKSDTVRTTHTFTGTKTRLQMAGSIRFNATAIGVKGLFGLVRPAVSQNAKKRELQCYRLR